MLTSWENDPAAFSVCFLPFIAVVLGYGSAWGLGMGWVFARTSASGSGSSHAAEFLQYRTAGFREDLSGHVVSYDTLSIVRHRDALLERALCCRDGFRFCIFL